MARIILPNFGEGYGRWPECINYLIPNKGLVSLCLIMEKAMKDNQNVLIISFPMRVN